MGRHWAENELVPIGQSEILVQCKFSSLEQRTFLFSSLFFIIKLQSFIFTLAFTTPWMLLEGKLEER